MRWMVLVCLLAFAGCSPIDMHLAKMNRLADYRNNELVKPEYKNNIEKERAFWSKARMEYPHNRRIDYLFAILDEIEQKRSSGQDVVEDTRKYFEEVKLFWEEEDNRAIAEQMRYSGQVMAVGQGFSQGFQSGYQMQQQQRSPLQCISNQYGNQVWTNCY